MIYAKKSLGQNFLIDSNILKKIVGVVNVFNKHIFEIGPGNGSLTEYILKNKPKSLTIIEKDYLLFNKLKKKYEGRKDIKIIHGDILRFNLEKELSKNTIIFGNLPFNISSQILVKLIKFRKWPPNYSSLILMFQKEMADRIEGEFGTSKYGRLSILTNYRLKILNRFNVSPNSFSPKPKVNSSVLLMEPKEKIFCKIKEIKNLEKITSSFFSNQRKMINKNFKKIFKDLNYMKKIKNLKPNLRPADLKPEKYYEITRLFEKLKLTTFTK